MLVLAIDLGEPDDKSTQRIDISLHSGYGEDAAVASQLLEPWVLIGR
jgi:hypothetical protein